MKKVFGLVVGIILTSNLAQAYLPSFDPEYNCVETLNEGTEQELKVFIEIYDDHAIVALNEEIYPMDAYGKKPLLGFQMKDFRTEVGADLVELKFSKGFSPKATFRYIEQEKKGEFIHSSKTVLDLTVKCRKLTLPKN